MAQIRIQVIDPASDLIQIRGNTEFRDLWLFRLHFRQWSGAPGFKIFWIAYIQTSRQYASARDIWISYYGVH